jgi:hypothetical protein
MISQTLIGLSDRNVHRTVLPPHTRWTGLPIIQITVRRQTLRATAIRQKLPPLGQVKRKWSLQTSVAGSEAY